MTMSLLLMAEIVGAHGIGGLVKLKIFADDAEKLPSYGTFLDADGKESFALRDVQPHGNIWLGRIEAVQDRTAAERLRGTQLFLDRARLPKIKKKDTFYYADLVGLTALYPDGKTLGTVVSVANFGAGDLVEIKPVKGASFYIPFTDTAVPDVNLAEKTMTVDPPEGLME